LFALAERKAATRSTRKSAKSTAATRKKSGPLTDEERAALKETIRERKGQTGEKELLAKIAEMPEPDRGIAKRVHAIVTASAPTLSPKTWYGMPAYANEDDKVVCFFTPASKFKERYATFGFNPSANLDVGNMWPTAFALQKLTATEETKIARLVKKSVR
jgi:uncharacterized protein YdhG (YjbR/CyaY superfamily)